MAGIDSLQSLFEDELKDIYDAEKQITKALPKMIKKAGAEELKAAFEEHLQQTQQHIERLEQVRPHRLVEIEHFFETYKALEDKTVDVLGWRDHERAFEVLRTDREAWERETGRTPA